jgi:hypothetical protein
VLSDEEARAIEQSLRTNGHGPLLVRWVEELLADRRERVAQVAYIRQRVEQALVYLSKLCEPRAGTHREAKERARRYRG